MEEKKVLDLDQMEQVTGGGLHTDGSYSSDSGSGGEKRWIKYKVQEGDTLWTIKHRYNCTVMDIKKWNNLTSEIIGPWMVLDLYTDRY